jgi:nitroimidazol reductase NimA-like FMN-containing flavoprotein (pyridoxamine 5'-phosphate oxidase superfamily)
MAEMSKAEIRKFVIQGTLTGKLATVKKEGSSHVVPIWFVVDNKNSKGIVVLFLPLVVNQSRQKTFTEIKE